MKRVGNADTISAIDFVIGAPSIGDPRQSWSACGADCTRCRHRYSGPGYEFHVEVIEIRRVHAARLLWHPLIVSLEPCRSRGRDQTLEFIWAPALMLCSMTTCRALAEA